MADALNLTQFSYKRRFNLAVTKFGKRPVLVGVAMVALSACAGQQLGMAQNVSPQGSEFQNTLSSGYLRLAQAEASEADYTDADYFARQSITAGGGNDVPLPEVASRRYTDENAAEVASTRADLAGVLDAGARDKVPVLAATTQVAYECWTQELEENRQPDTILRPVVTNSPV